MFRLGFATSRAEARQLVRHGHFQVNGRKTSTPSFLVKAGHVVTLRESSREIARIVGALDALEGRALPGWLEIDKGSFQGIVKALPGPRRHHAPDRRAAHRRAVLPLLTPNSARGESECNKKSSRRTGVS